MASSNILTADISYLSHISHQCWSSHKSTDIDRNGSHDAEAQEDLGWFSFSRGISFISQLRTSSSHLNLGKALLRNDISQRFPWIFYSRVIDYDGYEEREREREREIINWMCIKT